MVPAVTGKEAVAISMVLQIIMSGKLFDQLDLLTHPIPTLLSFFDDRSSARSN
jgi:hypothetical protein